MKDRIHNIILEEKISSSKFADRIGVQRSSVSHILSGRNNPSMDFIQKILQNFSNINAEWLLLGKGDMYKVKIQSSLFDNVNNENINNSFVDDNLNKSENKDLFNEQESIKPIPSLELNNNTNPNQDTMELHSYDDKKIEIENTNENISVEKIVIFYSNNTFESYIPK